MNRQVIGDDEHRQIARDSLFVLARLRLNGPGNECSIRVRNLSPGGLMAEGRLPVVPGQPLEIEIRNIGWVEGTVAWVQDNRFGIAFLHEIDPHLARGPAGSAETQDLLLKRPLAARIVPQPDPRHIRKV